MRSGHARPRPRFRRQSRPRRARRRRTRRAARTAFLLGDRPGIRRGPRCARARSGRGAQQRLCLSAPARHRQPRAAAAGVSGPAFDLALACCVLAAEGEINGRRLARIGLFAQLGLGGDLRGCDWVSAAAEVAGEVGLAGLIVAREGLREARTASSVPVAGLASLREVASLLARERAAPPRGRARRGPCEAGAAHSGRTCRAPCAETASHANCRRARPTLPRRPFPATARHRTAARPPSSRYGALARATPTALERPDGRRNRASHRAPLRSLLCLR